MLGSGVDFFFFGHFIYLFIYIIKKNFFYFTVLYWFCHTLP